MIRKAGLQRPLAWLATVLLVVASAASRSAAHCAGTQTVPIDFLGKLPPTLRVLLPGTNRGRDGIADRGGRFNATDVASADLPRKRFTLAAVAPTCAVIAVQYGGIATGYGLTEYHLVQDHWQKVAHWVTVQQPATAQALLQGP